MDIMQVPVRNNRQVILDMIIAEVFVFFAFVCMTFGSLIAAPSLVENRDRYAQASNFTDTSLELASQQLLYPLEQLAEEFLFESGYHQKLASLWSAFDKDVWDRFYQTKFEVPTAPALAINQTNSLSPWSNVEALSNRVSTQTDKQRRLWSNGRVAGVQDQPSESSDSVSVEVETQTKTELPIAKTPDMEEWGSVFLTDIPNQLKRETGLTARLVLDKPELFSHAVFLIDGVVIGHDTQAPFELPSGLNLNNLNLESRDSYQLEVIVYFQLARENGISLTQTLDLIE